MSFKCPITLALTLITCFAGAAAAQDRVDIDRTQVIGNRELPKVLYIVPWRSRRRAISRAGRPTACSTT